MFRDFEVVRMGRVASFLVNFSLVLLVSRCLLAVCMGQMDERDSQQDDAGFYPTRMALDRREGATVDEFRFKSPQASQVQEQLLRELCARYPQHCNSECASLALAEDNSGSIVCIPPAQFNEPKAAADSNQQSVYIPKSVLDDLLAVVAAKRANQAIDSVASYSKNLSATNQQLDEFGYWTEPQLGGDENSPTSAFEAAGRQQPRLSRTSWARSLAASSSPSLSPARAISHHELTTRAWRQLARNPNTYRVSFDEAERFIRAQQRQEDQDQSLGEGATAKLLSNQLGLQLASMLVLPRPSLSSPLGSAPTRPATSAGLLDARSRSVRLHRSENGQVVVMPKRTTSVGGVPGGGRQVFSTTSEHYLINEPSTTGGSSSDLDGLQCNVRRFTYKATKSDERGNSCSGFVTASICYGGCDTGEIADWLFPYKKSIHKVCRHGGRVRRRALLVDCTSDSNSINESLREYYYVDARDCVCKKCTSVNTTCLGTMTRPHLQTLDEAAAEIDQQQQQQSDGREGPD